MDELTSWKEIAHYLGVSVRTAQLWESQRGLPVRRLPGPRGRILATKSEIDAWKLSGRGPADGVNVPDPPKRNWFWLAVGAVVLTAGVIIGRQGARPAEFPNLDAKPLTSDRGLEQRPSLAPDGGDVAFLERVEGATASRIAILSLASGARRVVAEGLSNENRLAWSPDGRSIAYTHDISGAVRLSILTVGDAKTRALLELQGADRPFNAMESQVPGWTPDGHKICIPDRDRDGEPLALFLIDAETGSRERLTAPPATTAGDVQCAPSPDGRTIAFIRQFTVSEGDLHFLDRRDGQIRRVTQLYGHFLGLTWLSDNQGLLAGIGVEAANSAIWHVPASGGAPRRITGREVSASFPTTAAIGSSVQIVYQTYSRDSNIWRWSAATGAERFTSSSAPDQYPAVAATAEVAWISRRTGAPELYIASGAGKPEQDALRVTALRDAYADFPRWSPDGSLVAFSTAIQGDRDIVVHNRKSSRTVPVSGLGTEEGRASFSSNGKRLYFRSDRSGRREIWRSTLDGGALEQVTTTGGYEAFEDPTGTWLYFVANREKPGLLRMPVSGGRTEIVDKEVWEGRWVPAREGIYSLRQQGGEVWRTDWQGKNGVIVTRLPKSAGVEAGLGVSPDGKWIYWCQIDQVTSDLYATLIR